MKRAAITINICFANLSPIPKTHKVPNNISTSIVDAMRAIRMISVAGLKPHTFKSWADEIMNYLSSMRGNNLHVIFYNYSYEYSVPSKQRDASQMERVINILNQDLPPTKERNEFLMNYKNKLQIVNVLVDCIKSGRIRHKAVIVNQGSESFFVEHGNSCLRYPELDSFHKEADQKIPMHAIYVDWKKQ